MKEENVQCPECGSDLVYDFDTKFACDECGHVWSKENKPTLDAGLGIIRTYTGIMFDVFNPVPENICIEDIAHSLSNQCRFAGHVTKYYSVAEHSIKCAEMVGRELALQALLHDASEAYLVDIPSPLKIALPEYIEMEAKLMQVISEKYGFGWPLHHQVKRADRSMLEIEHNNLVLESNWVTMPPEYARAKFLELFDKITN